MNNSAEAEKYFHEKYGDIPKVQFAWAKGPMCEFAEAYHQFAREKELAQLTDEVIERVVKPNVAYYTLAERMEGAKALRDHLKQNNLKK